MSEIDPSHLDPSKLEGDMIPQGRYKPARELKELHENTDLDLKGVLVNTFILIVLCGGACFIVMLFMNHFVRVESVMQESRLSMRFASPPPPPAPLLQDDPAKETRVILDEAKARLKSYGWNDRETKTVHIPIDRAIAILAEKGLPEVGTMDLFHPRQGSSNPVKVGDPSNPVEEPVAAPKAEAAPVDAPKAEATPPAAPEAEAAPAPNTGPNP